MNILILGAGQVGGTLAEQLVREGNNVTVVDHNPTTLSDLQQRLDIRTVCGHAGYPDIITAAGGMDAEMIIAVTNSDETNMIGCLVAQVLFQIPTKIARIRSSSYANYTDIFAKKAIPIDVIISPESIVTQFIERLIEFPGALQVLDFANGQVQLIAMKPDEHSPLTGKTLAGAQQFLPLQQWRIVAIYRDNRSVTLYDNTPIEAGDEVFILTLHHDVRPILAALLREESPLRRIMIVGGGRIGSRLAKSLETKYRVKVIDNHPETAERLAGDLHHSTVLLGDASDRELLINENVEVTDVFCAVTNDDEDNIMSCLLAKQLGVKQVMAICNRSAYAELIESSPIDIAISPQLATTSAILRYLRQGDVVNVYSLRRGAAEAIEVIAHGDHDTSAVVGRSLQDIKLPKGTVIGAIVRKSDVIFERKQQVIEAGDHVILFVQDKKAIHQVERLFQVKTGFFA
jgi:trk system potassium uptake protein TrkA